MISGNSDVSVAINLHTVEFVSNFIMNETQLFADTAVVPWISLLLVSFPSTYRKLSHVYKSCYCMGILISFKMLRWQTDCMCESQTSRCDRWRLYHSCLGYQSSWKLRIVNSKRFKNSTNWASFSWCSWKWILSSDNVTGLVKNALSLCMRSVPFNTSISHYL